MTPLTLRPPLPGQPYIIPARTTARMAMHGLILVLVGLLLTLTKTPWQPPIPTDVGGSEGLWAFPPGFTYLILGTPEVVLGVGGCLLLGAALIRLQRGRLTTGQLLGVFIAGCALALLGVWVVVLYRFGMYLKLPPPEWSLLGSVAGMLLCCPLIVVGWLWWQYCSHPSPYEGASAGEDAAVSGGVDPSFDPHADAARATTAQDSTPPGRGVRTGGVLRPGFVLPGAALIMMVAVNYWFLALAYDLFRRFRYFLGMPDSRFMSYWLALALLLYWLSVRLGRASSPTLFGTFSGIFTRADAGGVVWLSRKSIAKILILFIVLTALVEGTRLGLVNADMRLIPVVDESLYQLFQFTPRDFRLTVLLPTFVLLPDESLFFPVVRVVDAVMVGLALHLIYPALHPRLVKWLPLGGVGLVAVGAVFPSLFFGRDWVSMPLAVVHASWVTIAWQAAAFVLLVYPLVVIALTSIAAHRGLGRVVNVADAARAIIACAGLLSLVVGLPQAMASPLPAAQAWQVAMRATAVCLCAAVVAFDVRGWVADKWATPATPTAASAADAAAGAVAGAGAGTAAAAADAGAGAATSPGGRARTTHRILIGVLALAGSGLIASCWGYQQALIDGVAPQWVIAAACTGQGLLGAAAGWAAGGALRPATAHA